jgi:aminocarboxymuconate-semialdehyde decarboxylase
MDARGIDISLMSLAPTLFHYWVDTTEGTALARMANDALAAMVEASQGRLAGLAALPMQDPPGAARELRRAVEELGFLGAHIGTTVESQPLDDPKFDPLWEAASTLGVPMVLHPYYVSLRPGYEDFYLTNLFANPLETALAASRLIFSGTLDRFPDLDFVLVHAGGFLPYQIGRLDHGWNVRPEPRVKLERPPGETLRRFYFDTITHHDAALSWLVELVGEDRVLLGTDLSFDMADENPVARVERSVSSPKARELVAGRNAMSLFNMHQLVLPHEAISDVQKDQTIASEGGNQ